jgi:FMN phosphatase YigB (HAD superfamily)
MPKILFIDWSNTLSKSFFWGGFASKDHKYYSNYEKICQFLFSDRKDVVNDWMRGKLSAEEICKLTSVYSDLSEVILIDELQRSCRNMVLVDETILEIIDQIRSNSIKCVIATDNMDTFRRFTIPALQLEKHFDDFLISSELGVCKYEIIEDKIPFFDSFLKNKKLRYEDVVLLDDDVDRSNTYDRLNFKTRKIDSEQTLINILSEYAK